MTADVASPEGQKALFAACPEPDILVNNNGGPPFRDFRELDRQKILDGVIGNMVVGIELIQKAIDAMVAKKFGRIVNITSGSVQDADRGPRSVVGRARRTDRVPGRGGTHASPARMSPSISCCPAYSRPIASGPMSRSTMQKKKISYDVALAERVAAVPARRIGQPDEFGAMCAFLCSAQAGYITGQNILIDGGVFPGAF